MIHHPGRAHPLVDYLDPVGAGVVRRRVMVDEKDLLTVPPRRHGLRHIRNESDIREVYLVRGEVHRQSPGACGRGRDERYTGGRITVQKDSRAYDPVDVPTSYQVLFPVIPG